MFGLFLFKFSILFSARGSKCLMSLCSGLQFFLCKVVILLWEKKGVILIVHMMLSGYLKLSNFSFFLKVVDNLKQLLADVQLLRMKVSSQLKNNVLILCMIYLVDNLVIN